MNGRMWNIGNNDSLERIFFLPQNIRNLNLSCIAEFYEMMKCDWMLYDIYFFNITSMMQPGQWNISGGIGFKIYPILNGRINIPESNASSILLRCMLFYMDSRIDLHEWKDEERVWNASSLDGKITIATVFLYRLCISYPPVGKIFLEYDWNCWVHFWIMVIIL